MFEGGAVQDGKGLPRDYIYSRRPVTNVGITKNKFPVSVSLVSAYRTILHTFTPLAAKAFSLGVIADRSVDW